MAQTPCCELAEYEKPSGPLGMESQRLVSQVLVGSFPRPTSSVDTESIRRLSTTGSMFLTVDHLKDAPQVHQLIRTIQEMARSSGQPLPLLIAAEQQGGLANLFLFGEDSTVFPSPLGLVAGNSTATTRDIGEAIGKELAAFGINWNTVPVIDPVTDLVEPSEVSRRWGNNFGTVSNFTAAFVQGLHQAGVATCATQALSISLQESYRRAGNDGELDEEFIELIESEVALLVHLSNNEALDAIMLSSCLHGFSEATRARKAVRFVVEKIIRGYLGFQGPVVANWSLPHESRTCLVHAPLGAFLSGIDMVFLPNLVGLYDEGRFAIHAAMEKEPSLQLAIFKSSERVTAMKTKFLNWSAAQSYLSSDRVTTLLDSNHKLVRSAYRASITSLQSSSSPLISLPATSVILLLTPSISPLDFSLQRSDPFEPLGHALSRRMPRIRHVPYTLSAGLTPTHLAFLSRARAVVLVLANASSALTEAQLEVWIDVEKIIAQTESIAGTTVRIVVSAGDVRELYHQNMLGSGWWGIACWDFTKQALEAVAEVLSGEREATGQLPITIRLQ